MQEYVNINIDGAIIHAVRGNTVLDTAIEYGICIPHLCHVPNLSDIGACRLCIVENVVNSRSRVTASCTLNVEEGMTILTNTDRIRKLRRNLAELLVAQAPNSRAIQDIAVRCGVTEVRYPFRNEQCVLCGRCVRICTEVWKARAKGFVGRGKERHVDFPFGIKPEFCKQCDACIQVCPMTITPCSGPMKPGEEGLCANCESQLMTNEHATGGCVWCKLGEGFGCGRYVGSPAR
jgi:NADH dehydrogenase/NADH:ubiquinone oxidoreductase subunit G